MGYTFQLITHSRHLFYTETKVNLLSGAEVANNKSPNSKVIICISKAY